MSNVCSTSVRHLLNVYCSVFLIYCTATSVNICRVWTICGKAWHKMAWFYQSLIMFTWFYYKILYTIYILQLVSDWPSLVGICAVIQPAVHLVMLDGCHAVNWQAEILSSCYASKLYVLSCCFDVKLRTILSCCNAVKLPSCHVPKLSSYVLSCHVAMMTSYHPALSLSWLSAILLCRYAGKLLPVLLLCWQTANLACCHYRKLSTCHVAVMSISFSVVLPCWQRAILSRWYVAKLFSWHVATLAKCHPFMLLCCHVLSP